MNVQLIRTGLVALTILAVTGSHARATSLTWNGTTGNASTTSKWSPSQLPVAADDLFFPGATTFTITFDNSVNTVNSHTYRNTVTSTLSITSPHTVNGDFDIATVNTDNATVHLGTGRLNIGGNATLGDVSGSTGTLTIDGNDASLFVTGASSDFFAGRAGIGNVTITGGGFIETVDDFIIGSLASGSGTVTVSGGTGSLPFLDFSHIETTGAGGDVFVGNNGSGTLNIQNGGFVLSAHDVRIGITSGETGSVDLSGAFSFLPSRLTAQNNLDIGRNDTALAAGNATLTLNAGTIATVNGQTRIGDIHGANANLVLDSATLNANGGVDMFTNGNISGTGTINGNIASLGDITATTAAGLTINGVLSNTTTNRITGTKIHFGPNGGYTGSGTCQVDITGDATSTITATGALSIGDNTTSGMFYVGTLDAGTQTVTLLDSNGAVLGGLVTVNGGEVACTTGIGVQNGGRVQGKGTLNGNVTMSGVLDPEDTAPNAGLISIQGNLLMNPSGSVDMAIGGTPGSGNNDRCNVTGTATFDGTMHVRLKNGYVPRVGEQFIAVNATAGRIGTFANITLDPTAANVCNDVTFVLVYSSTAAIVLIRPPLGCTALGDLNSDGGCTGKDIQLMINALLSPAYENCADMDGDCTNDVDDIAIFVNCLL
ncbi:MAG: hypothetical protein HZA51_14640 [Planctomycetes bacterium]|nr:hypothetical protein [Planctomycetota bacterium]